MSDQTTHCPYRLRGTGQACEACEKFWKAEDRVLANRVGGRR